MAQFMQVTNVSKFCDTSLAAATHMEIEVSGHPKMVNIFRQHYCTNCIFVWIGHEVKNCNNQQTPYKTTPAICKHALLTKVLKIKNLSSEGIVNKVWSYITIETSIVSVGAKTAMRLTKRSIKKDSLYCSYCKNTELHANAASQNKKRGKKD